MFANSTREGAYIFTFEELEFANFFSGNLSEKWQKKTCSKKVETNLTFP